MMAIMFIFTKIYFVKKWVNIFWQYVQVCIVNKIPSIIGMFIVFNIFPLTPSLTVTPQIDLTLPWKLTGEFFIPRGMRWNYRH